MRSISIQRALILTLLWVLPAINANAQFLGHNLVGDYGMLSATQPPPGMYLSAVYIGYRGDEIVDSDGNEISMDPEKRGELDVNGYGIGWWHVTDHQLLGGNYSYMIVPAWSDNRLRAPVLGVSQGTSTLSSDLYVQPINLGWNTARADFSAGVGVFVPTGDFEEGADDNGGLGFWSYELYGGATYYFDQAKTWHIAGMLFYETHGKQDDTGITVGDIVTLEGGIGKSYMDGAINVGLAYYGQWKVTDDDFGRTEEPDLDFFGRNRGFGIGPEITLPLASKSKLYGFFNLRYFWETGNRSTVEGESLVATFTFPIPSVPLQ